MARAGRVGKRNHHAVRGVFRGVAAVCCMFGVALLRNHAGAPGRGSSHSHRALQVANRTSLSADSSFRQLVANRTRDKCPGLQLNTNWSNSYLNSTLTSCHVPNAAKNGGKAVDKATECCFVNVMDYHGLKIPDGSDPLCKLDSQMPYLHWYYCSAELQFVTLGGMILWLLYLFILLGSTADEFFCPAVEEMSRVLRIPPRRERHSAQRFAHRAPSPCRGTARPLNVAALVVRSCRRNAAGTGQRRSGHHVLLGLRGVRGIRLGHRRADGRRKLRGHRDCGRGLARLRKVCPLPAKPGTGGATASVELATHSACALLVRGR